MKFLETPSLEYINSLLDSIQFGDQKISGKLEAYSCARAPTPPSGLQSPPTPARPASRRLPADTVICEGRQARSLRSFCRPAASNLPPPPRRRLPPLCLPTPTLW
ncbi:hypothetical protein T492DRAFT_80840 [Pavlovales sp. CCMP2436]|nr:hypothetical protein T492DRAFT_80840 [Pavlovales sp. CCMP2436]